MFPSSKLEYACCVLKDRREADLTGQMSAIDKYGNGVRLLNYEGKTKFFLQKIGVNLNIPNHFTHIENHT